MSLAQLWHTGKHLKGRQILARFSGPLRGALRDYESFFAQETPDLPPLGWRPRGTFLTSPCQNTTAGILSGRWSFVGQTHQGDFPPRWRMDEASRLWQYNLHYFDCLSLLNYSQAKRLVLSWIRDHPLHRTHVGWEPYCISLRLMNWLQTFFHRFASQTLGQREFAQVLWRSVYLQAQWLLANLETHLMGNHLLENAAALLSAGTCFTGPDAARWARRGRKILLSQLDEQILPDGGHFERSPMYQCRLLQVVLNLINMGSGGLAARLEPTAASMARALESMTHPDGQIALLNDAAHGIAPDTRELMQAAARLGITSGQSQPEAGPFALPHTGYYGWRSEADDLLICDAGQVGPDYIPGHAHGDIFSFELSFNSRRLIVDAGVYDYEASEMRSYCRSTRAHNTVEVAGQDQCEFWKAFRVARRGKPLNVRFRADRDSMTLSADHDAYRRLPGAPEHHRQFLYRREGVLVVRDQVRCRVDWPVVSRLHLHPDCRIVSVVSNAVALRLGDHRVCIRFAGNGKLRVKESQYCPRLHQVLAGKVLEFHMAGKENVGLFCIAKGLDRIPESLLT